MKRTVQMSILLFLALGACTENNGSTGKLEQLNAEQQDIVKDVIEAVDPSTVYPFPGNECVECQWYFCPPLDSVWQKHVCVDYCEDPPVLLHESECEEYLECDPAQYLISQEPCVTDDGFPGIQDKVCNKGQIQYTECVTDCEEESCNGEDDDCDGYIDETQLNECGECGLVPAEVCNGIDDDCDHLTDEELIQQCSTACGVGFEVCDDGNWISCTAPQPKEEICDGFDNDCDGAIDEDLECACTIQDVGVLFPCQDSPLQCGQGYRTCECADSECKEFKMTECYALCYWIPPIDATPCDPLIGMALDKEKCNNFDDNCNQLVDEDLYTSCYTGPAGTVMHGICKPGEMTCNMGVWGNYDDEGTFNSYFCKDEVTPQEEICNGLDDDCDGVIDWGGDLKDTDVLFIVDWSGSMMDEIDAVMIALNQFSQNFSEEEVIKWSFMRGPIAMDILSFYERLELYQDLIGFSDYLAALSAMSYGPNTMNTSYEMLLDAIYLAVHNITTILPYPLPDLLWTSQAGVFPTAVVDSIPELQNFKVSWRPSAEKIIIVFSDEAPQSYLSPSLILPDVENAVSGVPSLKLYTFSREVHKFGWESLAIAGNGEWYKLTSNPTEMYANLIEILNDMCTGAKNE